MCFSAEVSFGASAVLMGAGVVTALKIKKPSEIMFAAIPVIFAVQQFTEAMVWTALSNPEYASWLQVSTFAFMFCAQVLWPFWVPLSVLLIEKEAGRKNILKVFTAAGFSVAIYLAFRLIYFDTEAQIIGHHIYYELDFPSGHTGISGIFYFIVTVIPLFVSGVRKMKILGAVIVASFLITQFLYANYTISIWCFFAAIMSVIVYTIMLEIRKPVLLSESNPLQVV